MTRRKYIDWRAGGALAALLLFNAEPAARAYQQAGGSGHQHPPSSGQGHEAHHKGVNERGDKVMGFSHEKTAHHFRLKPEGGVIEVETKDAADTVSRDQIRTHLQHIAKKFAAGDFTAPMLIHAKTPLGVAVMKQRKAAIKYDVEETPQGARVRISTANAKARAAIHQFLRFQISDHQTGDSGEIERTR